MADLSDVADGLAALITSTLYPNGTAQPSATGDAVKVFQGWPDSEQLARDMNAQPGIVSVSIFPTKLERVLPLTFLEWIDESVETATLSFTLAAQTVTVGGYMPEPFTAHNLALIANGAAFVYAVQPGDTLPSIAAALQALIVVAIPGTTNAGPMILLPPDARPLAARVGVTGRAALPVRRQQRTFQITVWANRPDVRNRVGGLLDATLSSQYRITLADASVGNLSYASSVQDDSLQRQTTYRRDLFYAVDYQTVLFQTKTQITQAVTVESATPAGAVVANSSISLIS